MTDPTTELKSFVPQKQYFIGIDSDGCVFDTMEVKHKECFCPQFIKHFGLQAVSKYAREAWEFVNLYSKTRGCNRFLAVVYSLDLLRARKEVLARGVKVTAMEGLKRWVEKETKLGMPALQAELAENPDQDLQTVYAWSNEVNESIQEMVNGVAPFPFVKESLIRLTQKADAIVVSQTPTEVLQREWTEHDMTAYVRLIAGQEYGKKSEHVRHAAAGKYPSDKMLVIGDAPGDLKAAKSNNAFFYPIVPGREEQSWQRFYAESLERFFSGAYGGNYEQQLIEEFHATLPQAPSW